MENFDSLPLPAAVAASLKRMQFTTPTPIQAQAIPPALEGKDVLGSAQTGTGKTAAFAIPLISKLLGSPRGSALVLTPTRELAQQVISVVNDLLGGKSPLKSALIIGGDSMGKQLAELRQKPRILVGTPGRLNDHLERGSLMLFDTSLLILDETDRMLDMGFGVQIDKIVKFLPKQRQTLMFSATLPPEIIKMSNKYLTNPVRVAVGQSNATAKNVTQDHVFVSQADKFTELMKQINERTGSIIVFIRTKHAAEKMAQRLSKMGVSADAIHGDLQQRKREKVISAFRDKQHRVMVATDIASRGLDIPHIEHVINYDLPQCPEDYIHRIGRTARAGAEGSAISFVSGEEKGLWNAIQRLLNPDMKFPTDNDGGGSRSGGKGRPNGGNKGRPQGANRNGGQRRRRTGNAGGASMGSPKAA